MIVTYRDELGYVEVKTHDDESGVYFFDGYVHFTDGNEKDYKIKVENFVSAIPYR